MEMHAVSENLTAKALSMGDHHQKFHQEFNKDVLDKIKHDTSRTLIGRGEFDNVIKAATQVATVSEALHENNGELVEKHLLGRDTKVTVGNQSLRGEAQVLVKQSRQWLESFDKDGKRRDAGRFEKTVTDDVRDAKLEACQDLLKAAQVTLAQISPEMVLLNKLQQQIDSGERSQANMNALRQVDAQVLLNAYGKGGAEGGTSDIALVRAPDKSVAYAFKSISGESDQMGLPNGAGAIREVMASRACDNIKQQVGLDLGWPTTTFAELKGQGAAPEKGVLVNGLKGSIPATDEALANDKRQEGMTGMQWQTTKEQALAQSKELTAKLPELEVQKLLVCNLMLAQYDIKWDNAFIEKTGPNSDVLKARPFDGGAAFPSKDSLMDLNLKDRDGVFIPGQALLMNSDGSVLEAAGKPLDEQLQRSVLDIDTQRLKAVLIDTVREAEGFGVGVGGKQRNITQGAKEGIEHAVQSIEGIKDIFRTNLEQGNTMTLAQFADRYKEQVIKAELVQGHEQWLDNKMQEFTKLQQQHPELLKPLPKPVLEMDFVDKTAVWNNVMQPKQQDAIQALVQSGGANAVKLAYPNGDGHLNPNLKATTVLTNVQNHLPQQQTLARAGHSH